MRHFFTFLLSFTLAASVFSQVEHYNVLNIVGQIKVKGSGKILAKGDVISSEDQVVFMASNAMAAVFSPSKGRFTLKPKPDQKTGGEFYAFVKAAIIPQTQTLATRGGDEPGLVAPDADNEICGKEFLVLEGTALRIAPAYTVDASHFFYLKIEWAGEEISKKLSAADGNLFINPAEILVVDGKPISPEELSNFRLNYYEAESKKSTIVCTFTPLFADDKALTEEATIMVEADKNAGFADEKIKADVWGYLKDYYAAPSHNSFDAWYAIHFGK